MHKRTKAVAIPTYVKEIVWERDLQSCIFCMKWVPMECANAHVVNRSQGGLGVEQNIITACYQCHSALDNGRETKMYREYAKTYLKRLYPDWTEESVKYMKGES